MIETEKMVREINQLMRLMGEAELSLPEKPSSMSELDFLRIVKREYTRRLFEAVPRYRALKSEALIPDLFLHALRSREAELEAGKER